MLHIPPTNLLLLAAKQEPYNNKKNPSLNEKYWKNFPEKVQETGPTGTHTKKRQKE